MTPFISAICLTYGRPSHLEEAIACFLAQDYVGQKELLVLNTFPRQRLLLDAPGVKVVNLAERPPSLGAARNMAIELASGTHLITFDDDDLYLPHHLSLIAQNFGSEDWIWLSRQFYSEQGRIKRVVQGSANVVAFTKVGWEAIGRYKPMGTGEDRDFVGRLTSTRPGRRVEIAPEQCSFIYCWGNGVHHISGLGDDPPGRLSSYKRAEMALERQVRHRQIATGDIHLQPKLRNNYTSLARSFVAKLGGGAVVAAPVDAHSVGVVQLGRFGDIINILPICRHIAQVWRKPHLIVSREFASVLDGVSYVDPFPVDLGHGQINEALALARTRFRYLINCQIWGIGWQQERLCDSFNREAWRNAGFLQRFEDPGWQVVFDRRSYPREEGLANKLKITGKPFLLVAASGFSSPFPHSGLLINAIRARFEARFQVVDLSDVRAERIFDLLGLMDRAAALVSVDSALLHLAAGSAVPVVGLVNPRPWLGSAPRCKCVARLPYNEADGDFSMVLDAVERAVTQKLVFPMPEITPFTQTFSPMRIFHVVAKHNDRSALPRKQRAQRSWMDLYRGGVIGRHYSEPYPRHSKSIGDRRALPFLKDVLAFGMEQAAEGDIIMLTNDDNALDPRLPELLRYHVALYGACCSFRVESKTFARARHLGNGRDMFAFTKGWLQRNWEKIPDFLLGAPDWDWCLACIVRLDHGIYSTRANMEQVMAPAEIPTGYVTHQSHTPKWMFQKDSPGVRHNNKLFADWIRANLPDFQSGPKTPIPAPRHSAPQNLTLSINVNGLKEKALADPTLTLAYVHVPGELQHVKAFVESYHKFPPGYDHQTVVVCQKREPSPEAMGLLASLPQVSYLMHDNSGWDIGAFIFAAKKIATEIQLCCGESTYFKRAGWMARMVEAWKKHGPGFYGPTGSYEVSPHLNTSSFWTSPKIMAAYPINVVTKAQRYDFEHGPSAMWKLVAKHGLAVKMVTWDGEYDWPDWRKAENIFRRGDQSNVIAYWHHCEKFDAAPPELRAALSAYADKLTDLVYSRKLVNQQIKIGPESDDHFRKHHNFAASDFLPTSCRKLVVRRTMAMGDALAASFVATKLIEQGHDVVFQCYEIAHPIFEHHPILRGRVQVPQGHAHVDLDGAYENHPARPKLHMAAMYAEKANSDLAQLGIRLAKTNYAPRLVLNGATDRSAARWIGICPRSEALNRQILDPTWQAIAQHIGGECAWLGKTSAAPAGIFDFQCRTLADLVRYVDQCKLLVTVDTGPMHVAAALGVPVVVVEQSNNPDLRLSDQRDFEVIRSPLLDCLNCQHPLCPKDQNNPPCREIDPALVGAAVNRKLRQFGDTVSCVIAVYKPQIARLNKCLAHVLPQVDEVIVVGDDETPPLNGVVLDPKVRFVRKSGIKTGYGKKQNFGVRHSFGKFILQLNDDCFLEPDVVAKLKALMAPNVGIVSHLLRYPNGTIQYAGKHRPAGTMGFLHLDHGQRIPRIKEPIDQESVCGASILVRREVFYRVDGFDEDYYLYADDDDLALKVREAGYRIVFTPHAVGIHEEHCSSHITPQWEKIMEASNAYFAGKWRNYFLQHREPKQLIGAFA